MACGTEQTTGPTSLILTRQNVKYLTGVSPAERRTGTLKGAYTLVKEKGELKQIIIAAGSEVQFAEAAAKELGAGVRVVSMPCMSLFDKQPAEYRGGPPGLVHEPCCHGGWRFWPLVQVRWPRGQGGRRRPLRLLCSGRHHLP